MRSVIFTVVILISFCSQEALLSTNPNIIFILADDLGWNDVGFHGSNQIPTPNIDALAYTGIILQNYYVTPICTPSRSALLTGKYPIRTGMQHGVIGGGEPWGLSLEEVILPQYLKKAGYATAAIGKWHLGHFKKEYLPESRGFDSHYGYWTGRQDYYDHTAEEKFHYWGYDMRRGMNITWSDYGKYTTDLLTEEAVKVIKNHDPTQPLFLYLAHLATHSGNGYNPLQAPKETVAQFEYIKNKNRRLFAGMLSKLDDSVGSVVSALAEKNLLENSVVVFSTDNGGPAAGFNLNAASNWPLRGVKNTLWEGGVRGAGFIWSPLLPSSKISKAMIHITDWLPTLLNLTTIVVPENLDGVNVWEALSEGSPSPREEILLNIDTERNLAGLLQKNWKYIKGNLDDWNGWYGPSGRNFSYNWNKLYNSPAAKAINKVKSFPKKSVIKKLRKSAEVFCLKKESAATQSEVYLFDLEKDPCEQVNLAPQNPDKVTKMEEILEKYFKMVTPPRNQPTDPRSDPKYWGYAWINWMDYL